MTPAKVVGATCIFVLLRLLCRCRVVAAFIISRAGEPTTFSHGTAFRNPPRRQRLMIQPFAEGRLWNKIRHGRRDIFQFDSEKRDTNEDDYSSSDAPSDIVWTSLASTEKWISETSKIGSETGEYTRKSVSYECLTDPSMEAIVSGIFRQLHTMKEIGDKHGDKMRRSVTDPEQMSTLRQTLVVVLPASPELAESFALFNELIEAINKARRDARDYVTDGVVETRQEEERVEEDSGGYTWMTSVNLSHLHPSWGEGDEPGADEDEDPTSAGYRETRKKARQSPYPTVVLEVKSSPRFSPPESSRGEGPVQESVQQEADSSVSTEDVRKLESLFGKAASLDSNGDSGNRNDEASGDEGSVNDDVASIDEDRFTKSSLSPIDLAQNWVTEWDPSYDPETCSTSLLCCDSKQVDGAYEFIFSHIAAARSKVDSSAIPSRRDYIILSNFCTKSATSFEKFVGQLTGLIGVIPHLKGAIQLQTFHPEQVDKSKRSPVPILVMQWGKEEDVENESAFE